MLGVLDGLVLILGSFALALMGLVVCKGLGLPYRTFAIPSSIGLTLGLVLHGFDNPLMISTSDSLYYLRWAEEIRMSWESDEVASRGIWPGRGVFALILAYFGIALTAPQFGAIVLNSFFMGVVVVLLVSIQEKLGGSRRPNWTILLFLTMPGVVLFGSAPLRESVYWVAIAFGAWALSALSQGAFVRAGISLLGSIAVIMLIRPDAGLVVSYGLIFSALALLVFANKRIVIALKVAGIAVAGLLAVFFRPLLTFVRPAVESENHAEIVRSSLAKDSQTTGFHSVREFAPSVGEGGTCTLEGLGQFLCGFPANFLSATFGPFVSEIGGEAIWIPVVASTIHLLVVSFLSLLGLFKSKDKSLILVLISLALLTQSMHASILTNYGLLMRFKPVSEIFLIPIAASVASELFPRSRLKLG